LELLNKINTTDTAILVSTGPSLTKQLSLLKEIAPFVRIIAVDASFPVLYQAGIKPDVVVSMERVKESACFFQQVPKEGYEDVVTVLSSLQHQDVVKSPKGGTVTMSLRPLGYMIATGPKEWGYLGIGSSAANMAFELIYYSRFKNCILIGQDLAYAEDGTSHAQGHVFGEDDVKVQESDVWVKGWGGTKVRTNHNWTMFRNFFEKDLADIKEGMLTINATEGGASILGAKEIAFSEAISLCVNKNSIKKSLVLEKMPRKKLESCIETTYKNLDDIVLYISALLEEVKTLFLELATICDMIDAQNEIELDVMEALLQRIQNIKARADEDLYDKVVWHIAQSMMLVQEIDLTPNEVYKPKNEEESLRKMKALMQGYKAWLFSFAGIMDAILKTIAYARTRTFINEASKIEVYLENKKIDTISCDNFTATKARVFDVDMRGILYDVPDEYLDKSDKIIFKDAKNGNILPGAFVSVFRKDDEKYNELSFMQSLKESVDETMIAGNYTSSTIGFLATKENLEDVAFINYISELQKYFKDTKIIAYIIHNTLMDEIEPFEKIMIQNVSQLEYTQVLIINETNELDRLVLYKAKWSNILLLSFTGSNMLKPIKELNATQIVNLYRQHSDVFDLTEEDIKRLDNHILIATLISLKNIFYNQETEELFDTERTPKERSYKIIDLAFKDQTFVQNIVKLNKQLCKMVL
jgi:hypothetical protein